ncbi:MAG: hypothetical protein FWC91_00055 [Defluviitaleaceae bacterium]|nr:hypothetical protein [Defluviitaleaceae bacterium]
MALIDYKCPNCDGAINFDSEIQQMKCPFCDSAFDVESLKAYDDVLLKEQEAKQEEIEWSSHEDSKWQEGEEESMNVFACNSCAGEIIVDATTAATSCPFCGSPVVMKGKLSGSARPDLIIPFKLDKKAAQESLSKHLTGKRLLPGTFKSSKKLEEIKGVYVPFWLFDAEVDASMRYKATTIRSWSDAQYNYTETKFFNVVRKGNMAFDDVPVDASAKMSNDLMESIEPFDAKAAVPFQTAFLSGFLADKFDFCAEHCIERANRRIKKSTEVAFSRTVTGYVSVSPEHRDIHLRKSTVKYALLPVWVLNAKWQDKNYIFAMNGQTGKFVGDLPTDWGIFWRQLIIMAIIITVVVNIIIMLMGGI